jgi:COMPASS component BRE2
MAAETGASTGNETPKREPTPTASLSSIPQKRVFEDDHSPAVPSPLNPEANVSELPPHDDTTQPKSSKPGRVKKDSLKKREAKGGGGRDSSPATPDHRVVREQNNVDCPLRYKLAPPKPSDFDLPRGPVMTLHHEADGAGGHVEYFEISDQ